MINCNVSIQEIEAQVIERSRFLDDLDRQRDESYKTRAEKEKIRTKNYREYYQACKYGFEITRIAREFLKILVEWNTIKGKMDQCYLSKDWKGFHINYREMEVLMDNAGLKQASSYLSRMRTTWKMDTPLKKDLQGRISQMFDVVRTSRELYRKNAV